MSKRRKRLFGTDGIRAVAGRAPLDPATVRRVGHALARVLRESRRHAPAVVLGRDTRESGVWLRDALADGLGAGGATSVDAGIITTPGLALVTRGRHFDAGVMISASHNPFEDNGLKVFGDDGTKLSDDLEHEVERRVLDEAHPQVTEGGAEIESDPSLAQDYIDFLEASVEPRGGLNGMRLLLDCANGSAAPIAPEVFRFHGAEVETLGARPDGRNINLRCGSLHVEALSERVSEGGFDIGIAFDGDADRALAVDRRGRVVDGDYILFLCGRQMKRRGTLRGDTVVATIMSNLWLEHGLRDAGIRMLRAPVGDKYVLERMVAEDAVLGGEQSGHVIFRERSTTGDGILTGLLLLDTLKQEPEPLERILDGITPFPQVLLNVRVRRKPDLREHAVIGPAVAAVEREMADSGRVVLRYSGTEPLARVMIEGRDADGVRRHAERLVEVIRKELGA